MPESIQQSVKVSLAIVLLAACCNSCVHNYSPNSRLEHGWTDSIMYHSGEQWSFKVVSYEVLDDGSKSVRTMNMKSAALSYTNADGKIINGSETGNFRTDSVFSQNGLLESVCLYSYMGETEERHVTVAELSSTFHYPVNPDGWKLTDSVIYTYNELEQLVEEAHYSNGKLFTKYVCNYYPSGHLAEKVDYVIDAETELQMVASRHLYCCDADPGFKNRTEITILISEESNPLCLYNNTRKDFCYDSQGRIERFDSYFRARLEDDWSKEFSRSFLYQDDGKVLIEITDFGNDDIRERTVIRDAAGRLMKETTINKHGSVSYGEEFVYSYDTDLGLTRKVCHKITDGITSSEVYSTDISKHNTYCDSGGNL